jgi:hypothetical protein
MDKSVMLNAGHAAPQGDLNLNIAEAHAFNTTDKFSLDVFVVNGWTGQVCTGNWCICCGDLHEIGSSHSRDTQELNASSRHWTSVSPCVSIS